MVKGETQIKCPKCDGVGIVGLFTPNVEKCDRCNGTGEIEMSNDEWRRACSTEEFAEWLIDQFSRIKNDDYMDYRPIGHSFSEIIKWLKQPHCI